MITLEGAITLATMQHAGQVDKAGLPYILHPLRVMLAVPSECKVAAVLHDVLEDCDITAEELSEAIGDSMTMMYVLLLTKQPGVTRENYIRRICLHEPAVRIKVADINDNLSRVWDLDEDESKRLRLKYRRDLDQITKAGFDLRTGERL